MMNVTTTNQPRSFYGPTPEGFPPLARLTVAQYEAMIASGVFGKNDRFELIEGILVAKMTRKPRHSTGSELCGEAIRQVLPAGWHVRIETPVRIPARDSMPKPDVSVVRGEIRDYEECDPGPEDVALIAEVSDSTVRADRVLAATYSGAGIPVYWLINIRDRQLEVYTPGATAPVILAETDTVELVIGGQTVGRILVADLLPRRHVEATP
jgi:Uma2 family endonuclease